MNIIRIPSPVRVQRFNIFIKFSIIYKIEYQNYRIQQEISLLMGELLLHKNLLFSSSEYCWNCIISSTKLTFFRVFVFLSMQLYLLGVAKLICFSEVNCESSIAVSLPNLFLKRYVDCLLSFAHALTLLFDFYLLLLRVTTERYDFFLERESLWSSE